MLHGRISLNSVLLLLLVNFVSGVRLELMYISLIESIRSSLIHLHGFEVLVLLVIHHKNLKYSSDRLVIVAKGFLKLANLHAVFPVISTGPQISAAL